MNQPSEATSLIDLGLNGYEANAYVALTRRGRATGAEVARLAGLPRQRIYDVLDGLVGRGLATVEPGRPAQYTAVAPDDAIGLLLTARRSALEELEREAARGGRAPDARVPRRALRDRPVELHRGAARARRRSRSASASSRPARSSELLDLHEAALRGRARREHRGARAALARGRCAQLVRALGVRRRGGGRCCAAVHRARASRRGSSTTCR